MNTADIQAYFGPGWALNTAMAFQPPLHPQSVYGWGEDVPPFRQIQLEIMTQGALKADPGLVPDYHLVKLPNGQFVREKR